jgi:hypothetical protein
VKVNFWLTKPPGMSWLKLKEVDDVPAATDTGVKPEVKLTPPDEVLTHVTPHVMSKVSVGLIVDAPVILTSSFAAVDNGFVTIAVQD